MKHKYFFFICILFVFVNASAQPTLTYSSNASQIGDTYVLTKVDSSTLTAGNAGANMTWDFSGLKKTSSTINVSFVNPASTPDASTYPSSNLCMVENNLKYLYYKLNNDSLVFWGGKQPFPIVGSVVIPYTNAAKNIIYPFTFNNTYTDNLAATFTVTIGMPQTVTRTGTITVHADGYGTLMIPGETYTNVLRVKTVESITDASSLVTIKTDITSYSWYLSDKKYPLMIVSDTSQGVVGQTPAKTKCIRFFDKNNNINPASEERITSLEVIPNLVSYNDNLKLNITLAEKTDVIVTIYNQVGSKVMDIENEFKPMGKYKYEININKLQAGIYFIQMKTSSAMITKKFIVN